MAVGRLVAAAGAALALVGFAVHPADRQEVAGIGLAVLMTGMLVVLAGN